MANKNWKYKVWVEVERMDDEGDTEDLWEPIDITEFADAEGAIAQVRNLPLPAGVADEIIRNIEVSDKNG